MEFTPTQYHDTAELTFAKPSFPASEVDDTSVVGEELDCAHALSAEFFTNLIRMLALSSESFTPVKSKDASEMNRAQQTLPARRRHFSRWHQPRQSGVKA